MNSMFYFKTITPLLSSESYCAGAGIDLSSLSIVDGKVCWDLYIDGLVVSSDGNLLDALGAAIKVYVFVKLMVKLKSEMLFFSTNTNKIGNQN